MRQKLVKQLRKKLYGDLSYRNRQYYDLRGQRTIDLKEVRTKEQVPPHIINVADMIPFKQPNGVVIQLPRRRAFKHMKRTRGKGVTLGK